MKSKRKPPFHDYDVVLEIEYRTKADRKKINAYMEDKVVPFKDDLENGRSKGGRLIFEYAFPGRIKKDVVIKDAIKSISPIKNIMKGAEITIYDFVHNEILVDNSTEKERQELQKFIDNIDVVDETGKVIGKFGDSKKVKDKRTK